MKWTYSIKNKLTAAAVLFALCVLVLLSNYNDRVHSREVKSSINTLYADRLLVEGYIMNLSGHIYQIREGLFRTDSSGNGVESKITTNIREIDRIIEEYEKTKFTVAEETEFSQFKSLIQKIKANPSGNDLKPLTLAALNTLNKLSDIQLEESKSILGKSEQLYRSSKISSDFGFALVIIILLILQALVFSSKTFHISNKTDPANLN